MTPADDLITHSVDVPVPAARAFTVFTEGMAAWWPREYSWGGEHVAAVVVEPRPSGRWYERDGAGAEQEWGQVLAWEPPDRLLLSWAIGADRTPEPDPERRSEVEVRFVAQDERATRVELTHRHLARHGGDVAAYVAGLGGADGWPRMLDRFAAEAGGAE